MKKAIGYDRKRAAALMEANGLDIMFVTSPLNVYYASGYPTLHSAPNPILEALSNKFPSFCIIRRDGAVTLVHWNQFISLDKFCWVDDDIPVTTRNNLKKELWPKLMERGLTGCRVGVESDAPKYVLDTLTGQDFKMRIVECDDVMNSLRLVKSDEEISRLVHAAEMTQEVITKCIGILKEGLTDTQLVTFARDEMMRLGANDWNHFTVRFGNSDPEAPGIDRALKRGEIIRLDLGLVYKGYVSDINKHVILGPADEACKQMLARLAKLQGYCAERIRPGVNMNELGKEALKWYEDHFGDPVPYLVGHSIGLHVEDLHLLGSLGGPDKPFEENMVLEIEAWQDYKDTRIGVEDLYVITKTECKKISTLNPTIMELA